MTLSLYIIVYTATVYDIESVLFDLFSGEDGLINF